MRSLSVLVLLLIVFAACGSANGVEPSEAATPASPARQRGDTYFETTGDITISVDEAEASMIRIRGSIPALTITSAPASIKKLGKSYSVNLFFSNQFEPKPGTYPVQFSYRNSPDTLGGSFMAREGRFSHDTEGTAEFLEFGDQVKVQFEFQTFDSSEGTEGRKGVTVKGEAVCERADIF